MLNMYTIFIRGKVINKVSQRHSLKVLFINYIIYFKRNTDFLFTDVKDFEISVSCRQNFEDYRIFKNLLALVYVV